MRYLELLAPARNKEIGIAAINCGADAVYIAGPAFGARQAAGNSSEDIRQLCEYAHKYGAKIYITLNTIIFDDELKEAERILREMEDAGADAIIAQDLALLKFSPKIPLHASTQCAIRTTEKASFYKDLGFSRLVLEREMSLRQIKEIKEKTGCEIEFFVHGALCVCYSGNCYLSEAIDNRSANRGACMQACRSSYDLEDSQGNVLVRNKALLSLKDFNLLHRLEDLANAGTDSFKIEGRLKSISYVKNVVKAYSDALDTLIEKHSSEWARASFGHSECNFIPDTEKTFNRGYTNLFLDGKRGKWSSMDSPSNIGEYVGTINKIQKFGKQQIKIQLKNLKVNLHNGDGFSFLTGGGQMTGFRGDICENNTIICKTVPKLRQGQDLWRNFDINFERKIESDKNERIISAKLTINIAKKNTILINVISEDGRVIYKELNEFSEIAKNQARAKEMLISQLSKKAEHYDFHIEKVEISENASLPFMRASSINAIRREIAEELNTIPCNTIPLKNSNIHIPNTSNHYIKNILKEVDYKGNVANKLAKEIYMQCGAEHVEDAFELSHKASAELMRTKYCIRYELGICPKYNGSKIKNPLFLINNGRKLELNFDCNKCEMTVKG